MRRKRGTIGASLVSQLQQRELRESKGVQARGHAVTCARHDGREHGPCLLSATLRDTFQPNALLRAVSQRQPELRFYVRANAESFSEAVRGISILKEVADGAKITDKELELIVVGEEEAGLEEVVFVLLDRYLSKRDIWHLHLTMMQDFGALIYSCYEHNFAHHIPNSRIESMRFAAGQAADSAQCLCGRVSPETRVVFKSGSINMFILIQVSAELLTFGLSGRPYWEILLECFAHLVDSSVRVTSMDASDGHYVRVILFARARGQGVSGFEDYYEVAWEGYARALPPTPQMVARLRWVCLQLCESAQRPERGDGSAASWGGVVAGDLVEASRGNLLECLNHCLDHLDLHYLDRSLRVTGQKLVALTAGCGLVYATARKLYELTHRRFQSAGPSSEQAFHLICVREPPLHRVPWVTWPGGPWPCAAASGPAESGQLPVSPPWMDLQFYKEVDFCPCPPLVERPRSCLLPLESLAARPDETPAARLHVPRWDKASRDLGEAAAELRRAGRGPPWHRAGPAKFVGQDLIKELRAPELRSYFHKVETMNDLSQHRSAYSTDYSVQPSRFNYADQQSEKINTMFDLVGCRLEARTSEICYQGKATPGSEWLEAMSKSSPSTASAIKDTYYMQGQLIPGVLHTCTVRAADGLIQWKMEPRDNGLTVKFVDNTDDDKSDLELVYKCESLVRTHSHRRDLSEGAQGAKEDAVPAEGGTWRGGLLGWTRINRAFHMPLRPDWNKLDSIIAGDLILPAALPYPVNPACADLNDKCPGWQLRSAVKQHLFVLMPSDEQEHSHRQVLEVALRHLGHRLGTGVDPFCVLEDAARSATTPWDADSYCEPRQRVIDRFRQFTSGLDDLCFHKVNSLGPKQPKSLGIHLVPDGARDTFTVKRKQETIYIRDTSIGFPQSRDWFELFYDSQYSPPKLFVFALQWMVCSSNHLVSIIQKLASLAEKNGFVLLRTPIGQLFPQPAPHWVWSDKRETNFDRLAFHAPRKLKLPAVAGDARNALNAELLQCWLRPPLNFVFMFSSAQHDYKVEVTKVTGGVAFQLFQRLEGWMLCRRDGLCIVTLRQQHIFWFENRLGGADARTFRASQERFERLHELWQHFWRETSAILADHRPGAEAPQAGHGR